MDQIINYSKTVARETIKRGTGSFIDVATTVIPGPLKRLPGVAFPKALPNPPGIRLVKLRWDQETNSHFYRWYWYNPYGHRMAETPISREEMEAFGFDWCQVNQWYLISEEAHKKIRESLQNTRL